MLIITLSCMKRLAPFLLNPSFFSSYLQKVKEGFGFSQNGSINL